MTVQLINTENDKWTQHITEHKWMRVQCGANKISWFQEKTKCQHDNKRRKKRKTNRCLHFKMKSFERFFRENTNKNHFNVNEMPDHHFNQKFSRAKETECCSIKPHESQTKDWDSDNRLKKMCVLSKMMMCQPVNRRHVAGPKLFVSSQVD